MTTRFSPVRMACLAGLALAGGVTASPALAQQLVLGGSAGFDCYQNALFGRSGRAAMEECDRALRIGLPSPRDIGATYVNRAILYVLREDYDTALADVERSVRFADLAEAHATRGVIYFHQGRLADSVAEANTALERPDLDEPAKVYYNRAIAYEAMEDIDNAYYDYLRAAEADPDWALPRQELTRFMVVPADEAPPGAAS